MEPYSKIRMAVVRDGVSRNGTARRFGIDRGAVATAVGRAAPPDHRQPGTRARPKPDAQAGLIDETLRSDLAAPNKHRHAIPRILERLRDERGFGGYTAARDYLRSRRLRLKQVFAPKAHSCLT